MNHTILRHGQGHDHVFHIAFDADVKKTRAFSIHSRVQYIITRQYEMIKIKKIKFLQNLKKKLSRSKFWKTVRGGG